LIATATHDTAAAVIAVPARDEDFGYISSGTWALLGRELDHPLLEEQVLACNAGNEGGAFAKITFLKNIASMWLIQEARRTWAQQGREYTWDEITSLAMDATPFQAYVDPDDPAFLLPGDMPAKVQRICAQSGQRVPQTAGEILRVIFESLALKYRYTNDRLTILTGWPIKVMHVVGGGSQNRLLNQMTADALRLPVEVGPAEATTLGNVLVQMSALCLLSSAEEAHEIARRSFPAETYEPRSAEAWEEAYQHFIQVTGLTP
jgi:rhamnulokinase